MVRYGRAAVAGLVLVSLAGCGTRLTHQQLETDAFGPSADGTATGLGTGGAGTPGVSSETGPTSAAGGSTASAGSGGASSGGGPIGSGPAGSASVSAVTVSGGASTGRSGSGTGTVSGTGSSPAANSSTGPLAPIIIGNVSTLSGPAGTAEAPAVAGLRVWVKWINAQGGILGHPVQLFVDDDGDDPAAHAADIQDLVENKHVIAFVGNEASQTDQGGQSFLDQHHIPVVGGDTSVPIWYSDPMFFPSGAEPDSFAAFALDAAKRFDPQAGSKLGILVCAEAQICSNFASASSSAAPKYGYHIVYNGQASLAQPDYTSNCLSANSAGAGLLVTIFDQASIKRVGRSCSSQGYHPVYIVDSAVDSTFDGDPTWNHAVIGGPSFPFEGASGTGPDQFYAAIKQYDPSDPLSGTLAVGWISGRIFQAAAQGVGATPTTAQILNGLWSVKNDTFGGLVGPLTYNKGAAATPMRCYFPMLMSGGHWTAPLNDTPVCL
jgi:branched-chain amino acid transport system substrate-binding protein